MKKFTEKEYFDLISALFLGTLQGQLKWIESVSPDSFEVSFPKFTARISDTGMYPSIDLLNEYGTLVETIDYGKAGRGQLKYQGKDYSIGAALSVIYANAKRQALKTDELLEDFLKAVTEIVNGKDQK